MLLNLPAVEKESREIVAELVYANSSTINGKHFAEEFFKRRLTQTSQPKTGSSKGKPNWSDIAQSNAPIESSSQPDVNFKLVVSKKNRKRLGQTGKA